MRKGVFLGPDFPDQELLEMNNYVPKTGTKLYELIEEKRKLSKELIEGPTLGKKRKFIAESSGSESDSDSVQLKKAIKLSLERCSTDANSVCNSSSRYNINRGIPSKEQKYDIDIRTL